MEKITEKDLDEKDDPLMSDPLDLLTNAIKVHTFGIDLNEDATLANLNQEFTKNAKYVMGQLEIISILRSYLKADRIIIRYDNTYEKGVWGKEISYIDPEKKHFESCKNLLMNRVHSLLILSRSNKGSPLKAFLTYGRDTTSKDLGMEPKQGFFSRLVGRKPKEEFVDERR